MTKYQHIQGEIMMTKQKALQENWNQDRFKGIERHIFTGRSFEITRIRSNRVHSCEKRC